MKYIEVMNPSESKRLYGWIVFITFTVGVLYFISTQIHLPTTVSTRAENYQDWKRLKSDTNRFAASFPTAPQHNTKSVDGAQYDIYVSEDVDNSTYLVRVVNYPPEKNLAAVSEILNSAMDEMMQANPKNVLRNYKRGEYQHFDALDFSTQNPKTRSEGKAIFAHDKLYLVAYVAPLGNYEYSNFQHLLDEFIILPSEN